jgi:phosphoenolpyruvate carboxykinase (GTP)
VNWFRRDAGGGPLAGSKARVLEQVGAAGGRTAEESPIGYLPSRVGIRRDGLAVSDDDFRELCRVDAEEWRASLAGEAAFLARFGDRLPSGIREEHDALARRLRAR